MILEKCCLFSPVTGIVYIEGKLIKNAQVVRQCIWHIDNSKHLEETVTNEYGVFSFPLLLRSSQNARAHTEHIVEQDIIVRHKGKEYIAWQSYKADYELNSELKGEDIILICNLNSKPRRHEIHKKVYGIGKIARFPMIKDRRYASGSPYSILDPTYNAEAWLR